MVDVHEDIMKSRQAWFWRRTTLQTTLAALVAVLAFSVFKTATVVSDWQTVVMQGILVAAITWLVTMYFAMVDNASKVVNVVTAIGDAVDKARD